MIMGKGLNNPVVGDQADNLKRNLTCYIDALGPRTPEAVPLAWVRASLRPPFAVERVGCF
jgi:hypothetical protein